MVSAATPSTWSEYRFRVRLFWAALVIGLAATLVVSLRFLVTHMGLHGLIWPIIGWTVIVVAAGMYVQAFRCPRCQRRFFRSSPPVLALRAKRCMHCMLPKE